MKRLLLTSIAFAALVAGPATAADLARPVYRRPVVVAAPVYTWTGWYVGANAGASFGNVETDFNVTPVILAGVNQFSSGIAFSNREYPDGFIGGGQIGYNWQYSPP